MNKLTTALSALLLALFCTGCFSLPSQDSAPLPVGDQLLTIHFIDVGQADAALLQLGDAAMLIDGGNVADSDLIVSYLGDYHVDALDYVVCSHGHEDHVGGLAAALANFPVSQVLSPITDYDSNAFRNFLKYTAEQGLEITVPSPGDVYWLGEAKITILGPVQDYSNANDMSIVLRVDYGETSFLFTGDAERAAEEDLIESGAELESTLLKVCHHGSDTSSTYPFLYEVNPRYGVISCEYDGKYGHPHQEVLSRFRDADILLYRTDLQGHIIAQSDGTTITFTTEKNQNIQTNTTALPDSTVEITSYIGNLNSKVFHKETCSGLPQEQNQTFFSNRQEAISQGYTACGRCEP